LSGENCKDELARKDGPEAISDALEERAGRGIGDWWARLVFWDRLVRSLFDCIDSNDAFSVGVVDGGHVWLVSLAMEEAESNETASAVIRTGASGLKFYTGLWWYK